MMKRIALAIVLINWQACQPRQDQAVIRPTAAVASAGVATFEDSELAVGPLAYEPPKVMPSAGGVYVVRRPVEAVSDSMAQDLVRNKWNLIDLVPLVGGRRIIAEYSGPAADNIDCG